MMGQSEAEFDSALGAWEDNQLNDHLAEEVVSGKGMNRMTRYELQDQNWECAVVDCENPYVEDTGDFDEHGWTCGRDDCFLNDQ
tara:strand:- start:329 stop:580 length:252 start_codon:yes stop_codon:yes gene_type:complete